MCYEYGYVGSYHIDVIFMIILGLTLFFLKYILTPPAMSDKQPSVIGFHTMTLEIGDTISIKIKNEDETQTLNSSIGTTFTPVKYFEILQKNDSMMLLDIDGTVELSISHRIENESNIYNIAWKLYDSATAKDNFIDKFCLEQFHWYGVGHFFKQYWPLEKCQGSGAMVTGESGPIMNRYFGGIQERVVYCSSGVGLLFPEDLPIFLDVNKSDKNTIRYQARGRPPFEKRSNTARIFSYQIFCAADVKSLWLLMRQHLAPFPEGIPNETVFQRPIWSTWAEYKKDINQYKVEEFAKKIRDNNFPCSIVEIDDDWTPHYGDLEFDKKKFPSPDVLIKSLKEMGYMVSLWVHPYANLTSNAYKDGWRNGCLVNGILGLPAIFKWWNGYAGLVDFTNEKATDWFSAKLEALKSQYDIDTFKLDAGEGYQLSYPLCRTERPLNFPNMYTNLFVQVAHKSDTENKAQEVRVGSNNQNLPMFFRLQDKDSNWGYFNGLKTVIPHVLTQGLLGYPFVLPDMIGGNAYSLIRWSSYPDRELYIRWIQLNALMPAMQFSIPPWRYDKDVVTIAQQMCQLHENYSPKIIELANESTQNGAPICRPLWWIAPDDPVALTIGSEFLLGDDILVAPVLDKGAVSRDIYLPAGTWRDCNSGVHIEGGKWYQDYSAKLNELPYFEKAMQS